VDRSGLARHVRDLARPRPTGQHDTVTTFELFSTWCTSSPRPMHHSLSVPRLVTVAVLAAALSVASILRPLPALGGVVLVLVGFVVVESWRYADVREGLRGTRR
jgi:hypothetical protein